ncbi:hypothetical protein GCM10028801_08370 [Nocardioides maradonensis]
MAWWALFSAMFWLYVATSATAAYGARATLIGMGLAVLAFAVINRVLAAYALRTRATVERVSAALFGTVGSTVATLLIAATALYYAVFEGSVIALTLQDWFGGPIKLWYAVCVAYAVPLAAGGVRHWLDRLNGYLLPFYCVGLVALVIAATVKQGYPSGWLSSSGVATEVPGWLGAFLIYMGIWVMMLFTIDFASLGRVEDTRFHQRATFGGLFYFCTFVVNGLIGMYVVSAFGVSGTETGVVRAVTGSLGFAGVLLVVVSQTRINTANYFLASNNLGNVVRRVSGLRLPHLVWVAVCGVLAYSFMLTDVLSYLLTALAWQGVLIIAWTGVVLVHVLTGGRPDTDQNLHARRPQRGLAVAWVLASTVGLVTLQLDGHPTVKTLSPVFTVLISMGVAYAAGRQAHARQELQVVGEVG